MTAPDRLIVAITGASGSTYGIRVLQLLRGTGVEAHLVMNKWGARTLAGQGPFRRAAAAGQRQPERRPQPGV